MKKVFIERMFFAILAVTVVLTMRCIDKMLNKLSETKPVLIGGTKENGYYHVLLPTALELAVGMINPKEWAKERGVKLGKDFNYCVVLLWSSFFVTL